MTIHFFDNSDTVNLAASLQFQSPATTGVGGMATVSSSGTSSSTRTETTTEIFFSTVDNDNRSYYVTLRPIPSDGTGATSWPERETLVDFFLTGIVIAWELP